MDPLSMHAYLPAGGCEFVEGPPVSFLHATFICFPHKPRFPTKLQSRAFSQHCNSRTIFLAVYFTVQALPFNKLVKLAISYPT